MLTENIALSKQRLLSYNSRLNVVCVRDSHGVVKFFYIRSHRARTRRTISTPVVDFDLV